MSQNVLLPKNKEPTLRVTTRLNDTNPKGDIFGGWLMSQIDIAGAIEAVKATKGEIATVAVNQLTFINPLYAHDVVSFYAETVKVGRSSVTVAVEVFAQARLDLSNHIRKISDAVLVYVAVDGPGKKRLIPK